MNFLARMKNSMKRITNKWLDQILARPDDDNRLAVFFDLIPFDKESEKIVESMFKVIKKEEEKKFFEKAAQLIELIKNRPYTFMTQPN